MDPRKSRFYSVSIDEIAPVVILAFLSGSFFAIFMNSRYEPGISGDIALIFGVVLGLVVIGFLILIHRKIEKSNRRLRP